MRDFMARWAAVLATSLVLVGMSWGCAAFEPGSFERPLAERLRPIDGLDRVEVPIPGVLEIREQHGIGGYDALLIPDASLRYRPGSLRLSRDAERIFLGLLRESIVDATQAAAIPLVDEPGECVMEISLGVLRLDLDIDRRADQLAEMILVMEFRDSSSRQPLLRYARVGRVQNPEQDRSHDQQLRRGLDAIVERMNLANVLRPANLADEIIRPGCRGTLAARGRAASGAVPQ